MTPIDDEPVELNIGLEKIRDIVLKAREFDLEDYPDVGEVGSERAEECYEEADFTAFNAGHARRVERMSRFLERNGLRHSYQPGLSAARFDARMAALRLPPAVRPPSRAATLLATLRARLRRRS